MDRRRAAGALLALAACIACSAAAPTASNHTTLDLYDGSPEGCYYNFQHYGEGDRIMTNEPCLNCTCHNRMLMCYLRVCPFTKPIGQDCSVEKRADQCCPIVTCPDVPVDLLTSTSTTSPAEYGATGLGKLDKYGCSIHGKYFPEGSKVPPTPNKPCEHCYCIRNMTTCVMQECTLHVDGCTPIYHKDVCCPVRYSCDHPEDEVPLLDDMSTTVRPTPGFLLTTTTLSPVTQMTQDCVHNDQVIADGASITTEKACEHCYCMKGDIVCVVQECGAPMENEGKNCTSLPPREGQCCPDTYICEGDELSTEIIIETTTDSVLEKLTTLLPPRRGGIEGSGYRNEPNEAVYTEMPTVDSELEGSGEEEDTTKPTDAYESLIPEKPLEPEEMTPSLEDGDQYIPVTTKSTISDRLEITTEEINKNYIPDDNLENETIEPQLYLPTTHAPVEEYVDKMTTGLTEHENLKPHDHATGTYAPETFEQVTTGLGESLNTVPDTVPEREHEKPYEYIPSTTDIPTMEESGTIVPQESVGTQSTPSDKEQDVTMSSISEGILEPVHLTPSTGISDDVEKGTTEKSDAIPEVITEKESSEPDRYVGGATGTPSIDESTTLVPKVFEGEILTEKESSKPELYVPSTSIPEAEIEKLTTEPDHAQNTVAVSEEGYAYPHPGSEGAEKITASDFGSTVTEKVTKEDELEPHEHTSKPVTLLEESEITAAPDKGLNTIPSAINEESSSLPSLVDKTTLSSEKQSTESSTITDATESQDVDTKSPVTSGSSIPLLEAHITKGEQYTITTEPSFRREDEASVATEKQKEESAPTTIKPEFVDEGLIPTSTHDEKLSIGSDVSTIDEDITTMMPEYNQELEETITSKQPITESSLETSVVSETLPSGLSPSTEKSADVTAFTPDIDTHEEPSRIPGEGDCLLNGVTYTNNTIVPSTNNCHTGCKCVSSIIKCDPIICSPPPDYMNNCQSIYDTPDSCCPTYVCDHPKETIPPQSDNQMSGTEPPMPPPVIECRGDQCELTEPTKQTSEHCTSGDCLPTADHKPVTSDCGPEGCSSADKESIPAHPSVEKPECTDGKCEPAEENCAHGECQSSPTHSGEKTPSPQLCENEDDCKKIEVSVTQTVHCEGDSCKNVDCRGSGCDSNVISPPQHNQQVSCKEEDGCIPQGITPSDCTGDLPCRRKDVPIEELPSECVGSDCVQKTDTSVTQNIHQLSTESSLLEQTPLEEATEKIVPGEGEKTSEPTDTQILHEKVETTPISESVTEKEYISYETTEAEIKTDEVTQQTSEVKDITTQKPILFGEEGEGTRKPDVDVEEYTDKPALIEEEGTKIPDIAAEPSDKPALVDEDGTRIPDVAGEVTNKPALVDDASTQKPDIAEEYTDKPGLAHEEGTKTSDVVEEHTDKPALVDEQGTKVPDITEEHTDKPTLAEEEGTKITDTTEEHTDKPALVEEEGTKKPDIAEEHSDMPALVEEGTKVPDIEEEQTDKPVLEEEEGTKIPDIAKEHTVKPALVEEEGTKIPYVTGEHTDKPALVEEGTKIPDVQEEHTDKPALEGEEGTKITDATEEYTDKPALVEEKGTKIPDIAEEHTDKAVLVEEKSTKIPDTAEVHTDKPGVVDEEITKIPDVAEEYTDKPDLAEVEGTKTTDATIKRTDKPALVEEEGTTIPDVAEEHTEKSGFVVEESTKTPDTAEQHTGKPATVAEEATKVPDILEEDTDKPTSVKKEGANIPDVAEEHTDKPVLIEEEGTKIPDMVEEHTDKPAAVEKESTKIPDIAEEYTDKPALVEEEGTKIIDVIEEHTDKPDLAVEEGTKIPDVAEEHTDKPVMVKEESTKITDTAEEHTDKPTLVEEDGTKIPDVVKEHTDKIALLEEESTKKPDIAEEHTDRTALVEEEGTKIPAVVEEHTDKTALVAEDDTKVPDVAEEHTDRIASVEEEGTKIPDMTEEHTDKPAFIPQEGTKIPDVTEEHTGKPALIDEEATKIPDVTEEHTDKSVLIDEEGTKIPDIKEHTDKPISVDEVITELPEVATDFTMMAEDDIEGKPILVEEELPDKPTVTKEDPEKKPSFIEKEGTSAPTLEEQSTDVPQFIGDSGTQKPMLIDEGTLAPVEIEDGKETEEETTDNAIVPEDKTETKPSVIAEGTEEPIPIEKDHSPTLVEKEHTDEPQVSDVYTDAPEISDQYEHISKAPGGEDTRRTETPGGYVTEHVTEIKLPETSVEEHTKTTDTEIEKSTSTTPIYESQTTAVEDGSYTESYLEPIDVRKPEEESPDVKGPSSPLSESQESSTVVPDKQTHEFASHSHIGQEKTTKTPLREGDEETYQTSEQVTASQEPLTNAHEATKAPEIIATTEKVIKSTESETIAGETYTNIPEQQSSVTKSPGEIITDPQEGRPSESPDLSMKGPVDKENTASPESHVTDTIAEYEGSSAKPVTVIPEVVEAENQKIDLAKPHEPELEEIPTKSPGDISDQEIKTGEPDIFTPEEEGMITSAIAVTEPVKGFTEIEDSSVTGKDDTSTGYHGETTERFDPFATEKTDEGSETASSSETPDTKTPEESHTESHDLYTETPVLRETKPSDIYQPSTTESPEMSHTKPESGKPVTGDMDHSTEMSEADTKIPGTTELSVSIVTESQEKPISPVEDVASQEERTTKSPDSGIPTVPVIYVPGEQEATEIPESHVTASAEPEPSKPTESSYTEQQMTEAQETGIKSEEPELTEIQKTTAIPTISDTQSPELTITASHDTGVKEQTEEVQKPSTEYPSTFEETHTELPHAQISTEASLSLVTETQPDTGLVKDSATEKYDTLTSLHESHTKSPEQITEKPDDATLLPEVTTPKQIEEVTKSDDQTSGQPEFSETTPYLIELQEHTHKMVDETSTISSSEAAISTSSVSEEEHPIKTQEHPSTELPSVDYTHKVTEDTSSKSPVGGISTAQPDGGLQGFETTTQKIFEKEIEAVTQQVEIPSSGPSDDSSTISEPVGYQTTLSVPEDVSEKLSESSVSTEPAQGIDTTIAPSADITSTKSAQDSERTTPTILTDTETSPTSESNIVVPTEKESLPTEKPLPPYIHDASRRTTVPEDELILATTKATTVKQEDIVTPDLDDKFSKPVEKPTSEIVPPSTTADIPKPPTEVQPTDEITTPDEDGHFPSTGYGEPDYVEEDQAFGPGTCRYGGKVYVSAQQIPRDDPCDFCFCFRSDIICLQQSCPPPIHGCHEEPIQGFCCPRYECPVSMATTVNVTTTTTTTTTTLPPHFPTHSYKGAAQRRGCQIKGHTYKVGEVVRSSSGPCLHCTCGGDGQMKCDPKACTPEPMLRQMIAAAVSAKRRR